LSVLAPSILITGGAGFVGYHLAKHLLMGSDARVVIADNLQRGRRDHDLATLLTQFEPRIRLITADLTTMDGYRALDQDFDQIYHLAAVNGTKWFYEIPDVVLRVNILSLVFLLDWINERGMKPKLCFTSSNEAYAGALEAFDTLPLPTPETVPLVISDPFNPRWSYAGSKLVGELLVIHSCNALGLPGVIVRPHNLYGPRGGYDHVIPELCLRTANRADPFVVFGADQTRTFCHIEDAVVGLVALMATLSADAPGADVFNIGGTGEVTMMELVETLFEVVGWSPERVDQSPAPPGSVRRRLPDISKIQQRTGWVPEISLSAGLRNTFDWYVQNFPVQGLSTR
jgi:nucleoside-diphosphate-sugar epimerase